MKRRSPYVERRDAARRDARRARLLLALRDASTPLTRAELHRRLHGVTRSVMLRDLRDLVRSRHVACFDNVSDDAALFMLRSL